MVGTTLADVCTAVRRSGWRVPLHLQQVPRSSPSSDRIVAIEYNHHSTTEGHRLLPSPRFSLRACGCARPAATPPPVSGGGGQHPPAATSCSGSSGSGGCVRSAATMATAALGLQRLALPWALPPTGGLGHHRAPGFVAGCVACARAAATPSSRRASRIQCLIGHDSGLSLPPTTSGAHTTTLWLASSSSYCGGSGATDSAPVAATTTSCCASSSTGSVPTGGVLLL